MQTACVKHLVYIHYIMSSLLLACAVRDIIIFILYKGKLKFQCSK